MDAVVKADIKAWIATRTRLMTFWSRLTTSLGVNRTGTTPIAWHTFGFDQL
jgi:hypothetical protein